MRQFDYGRLWTSALLGWTLLFNVAPAETIDPLTVEKSPSFLAGEQLKFKLGWSFFKVARATMNVEQEDYDGKPALKISLNTRTNSFADSFYKVRNLSTSWVADDMSRSFEYQAIQQEGSRDRDTQALFDPEALRARYINNKSGETQGPVEILPGTFDPLGIVYFIRCLDFEVGDELVIPTSNGKEFFYTIVHVVKKVTKRFRFGKMEAYVLEPDIKDIGGVFKRSEGGRLRFYFSTDERKLPLRMESEVAVGRFWAELVDVIDAPAEESVTIAEVE